MNVACVYIRADNNVLRTETMPLGIACISAVLKSIGCNSEMLYVNNKTDISALIHGQERRAPKIFAVSVMDWFSFSLLEKLNKTIKQIFPKALIIIGGTHPTLGADQFVDEKFCIDAICIGEGETAIKKYAAMAKTGIFTKTDNLWLKTADGWLKCDNSFFEKDLDAFPLPDREAFLNLALPTQLSSMCVTRGCANACIYCLNQHYKKVSQGIFLRYRNINNVVEEIKQILALYPETNKIMLNTDSITDKQYLINLCEALEKLNSAPASKINFMLRINFFPKLLEGEDITALMKKAGINNLQFGLESGSPGLRVLLKRPYYTNEQIIEFCRRLRDSGVATEVYVMYCHPFETKETYRQTLDVLKAIKADVLRYQYLIPLDGSEVLQRIKELGSKYKKMSLVDYFRLHTTLFRVYITYKPFFESLTLAMAYRETGDGMGLDLKTPFVNMFKKFMWKGRVEKENCIKLGKEAFDGHDWAQAVKYLSKVKISADNLWVKGDIALAQMHLGEYENALKTLQKILKMKPSAAEAENFKKLQAECLNKINKN